MLLGPSAFGQGQPFPLPHVRQAPPSRECSLVRPLAVSWQGRGEASSCLLSHAPASPPWRAASICSSRPHQHRPAGAATQGKGTYSELGHSVRPARSLLSGLGCRAAKLLSYEEASSSPPSRGPRSVTPGAGRPRSVPPSPAGRRERGAWRCGSSGARKAGCEAMGRRVQLSPLT